MSEAEAAPQVLADTGLIEEQPLISMLMLRPKSVGRFATPPFASTSE